MRTGAWHPRGAVSTDAELFDVLAPDRSVLGQAPRLRVHMEGLLHQSVHVVVYHGSRMLVQQRAASKRIAPLLWDLSCAEHLQPGETHAQAAVRGLREELGLAVDPASLRLVRDVELRCYRYPYAEGTGNEYVDREFIALFALQADDVIAASVRADEREVAAIEWRNVDALLQDMAGRDAAQRYAPWFLDERPHLLGNQQ